MKQIPNFFTLLNLVFGCLAIVFILQTGQSLVFIQREGYTSWDLPEKITWGSVCIFAAALVDFLDGFIARLFKAESPMGKQLDSLADMVSFGVAPGLIFFQLLRLSFAQQENGLEISIAYLLPAFLLPCAIAWRLARFNLDDSQRTVFKGVPAPAIGLVVAALPMIIFYEQFNLQEWLLKNWVIYGLIIILSGLLVSRLPMLSLKFNSFKSKNNLPVFLLIAIAIVAIVLLKWVAAPVILLAYVLVSLLFKNKIA